MFALRPFSPAKPAVAVGLVVLATLFALIPAARAAFVVPAFRGGANTTFQEWEVFDSLAGPNGPEAGTLANPNGLPNLRELTGAGFVPGSGNIYVDSEIGDFEATVPDYGLGAGHATNVVAQIRTLGATLDVGTVLWNGIAPASSVKLAEAPLGGFGGVMQEWKFEWNLLPGNLSLDVLTFKAASANLSLDRVSIDTQAVVVPEAGSLTLGLLAASSVGAWALRRRSGRA